MNSDFIQKYEFGEIIIDNQPFTKDLILLGKEILPNWWRRKGHSMCKEDLEKIIDYEPELLIIGKGASAMMEVPPALIESLNFKIESYSSKEAVEIYNKKIAAKQKIAEAFHLTC